MQSPEKAKDYNRLYQDAESIDADHFSEGRTNVLLVAGQHYTRQGSHFEALRRQKSIPAEKRLRITKNHIQKISKTYKNNILTHAPGVKPFPKNESELQDQKAAELNFAVWRHIKQSNDWGSLRASLVGDYVDLGEVFTKTFFDPNSGRFIGFEAEVDEAGQLVLDELGNPKESNRPVFSGAVKIERYYGFDVLRDPSAKSFGNAKWICLRKMVVREDLKGLIPNEDDRKRLLEGGDSEETYTVFEGASNQLVASRKEDILLKEFYFRPCQEYPRGWFALAVKGGTVAEGPLPFGIFPIDHEFFDEFQTSPRGKSIIKQLRPFQSEVNRMASQMATHQITLGDDKVVFAGGGSISDGGKLPGVRAVAIQGSSPTIISGRTGEQFLPVMESAISEMYGIANVVEDDKEKDKQLDPFAMLFRSMRDRKKFVPYAEKFERFEARVCEKALRVAKAYYDEQQLIPAVGRSEIVNVSEFLNTNDLSYEVKIEAASEELESSLGKHLELMQIIQYVGNKLGKEDIGKLIRASAFLNKEQAFSDFTLNYDAAVNVILALDRGEMPETYVWDDHKDMLQRLQARMRKSDFKFLSPEIQANYIKKREEHEKAQADQVQQIAMAKQGMIPMGGHLVAVDFYGVDPSDPLKTKRVRLPSDAIDWLFKRLQQQGLLLSSLGELDQSVQSDIASMVTPGPQGPENPGSPEQPGTIDYLASQGSQGGERIAG